MGCLTTLESMAGGIFLFFIFLDKEVAFFIGFFPVYYAATRKGMRHFLPNLFPAPKPQIPKTPLPSKFFFGKAKAPFRVCAFLGTAMLNRLTPTIRGKCRGNQLWQSHQRFVLYVPKVGRLMCTCYSIVPSLGELGRGCLEFF